MPVPVRKGYVFKGWYTKKSGGTKITAAKKVTITKGKTQKLYAQWSKIKVDRPAAPQLSKKSASVQVKWKKTGGAGGYEIWLSPSSKFKGTEVWKKTVTKSGGGSVSFGGLKKGRTYYARVRAFKKDALGNRIYGKYSAVKKIKVG